MNPCMYHAMKIHTLSNFLSISFLINPLKSKCLVVIALFMNAFGYLEIRKRTLFPCSLIAQKVNIFCQRI